MVLVIGDEQLTDGMAASVHAGLRYKLRQQLDASIQEGVKKAMPDASPDEIDRAVADATAAALKQAEPMWKCISYGIAAGLVWYLRREPPDNELPADLRAELEKKDEDEYAETCSTSVEEPPVFPWLNDFVQVFNEWEPLPSDGGQALKTKLEEFLAERPTPTELNTEGFVR